MFPVREMGDPTWSERLAAACDPALSTYHAGWVFMACYTQHMSSLLQEVTAIGAHQHLCMERYDHQVEAKDCLIADVRKGNRELLQQNHILEMRIEELNNKLMKTYCSCFFKTDALDSPRTWL
jgi:hypothetical protein